MYDEILLDIVSKSNTEVIVATGLSQKPYDQVKFYYRLKDHKLFLEELDIVFTNVVPRMTRDFLVSFDNVEQAAVAEKQLSEVLVNNEVKLFNEIDNRGKDIFVVLTYPSEITQETTITFMGKEFPLSTFVTFVAVKNGEHQGRGFSFFSDGISEYAPQEGSHISEIHNTVLQFFGIHS